MNVCMSVCVSEQQGLGTSGNLVDHVMPLSARESRGLEGSVGYTSARRRWGDGCTGQNKRKGGEKLRQFKKKKGPE